MFYLLLKSLIVTRSVFFSWKLRFQAGWLTAIVNLFEQFHKDDSRVEVEEDCQWKSHPLDDDPRHEAVEVCLNEIGFHLL